MTDKKITKKPAIKKAVKITKKSVIKKTEDFIRAVGRRKSSVARVRMYPKGKGKIIINQKDYIEIFPYFELNEKVIAPLKAVGKREAFDFSIKVCGGGKIGQAEACRHGIARSLIKFNEEDYRKTLRAHGFLTRDPRKKERKKPGLKKARRAPQWSKR
ncbi:30S ribosomal protein S9 [Patescibacteria group bacterium]